jgi:long-chain acyl-CoA synthetase
MGRREPLTLQAIAESFPGFGSRPAAGLREDLGLRWWSYRRLHHGAQCAAALLRAAGVGKGDRLLIRARNSPEWVAFFYGAMLRGAVVVPLDYDSPPELVQRIAAVVQPKALLAERGGEEVPGAGTFIELESLHEARCGADFRSTDVIAVAPDDPAVIFYTSGTTSAPRGITLTHANIVAQALPFRRWLPLTSRFQARMLVMAPFSHAQGFVLGVVIPLSLGLSAIYTHLTHPGHLVRILRDNRVLLFSTVPRVLHVLARAFESQTYGKGPQTLGEKLRGTRTWALRRHYVFTHMRRAVGYSFWVVLVGGAPLPPADEEFWRVSGCLLVQGYGLTETTAIVSVNMPLLGRAGSVGRPLGEQEIRLAGDGEILVRGPNVMAGGDDERFDDGFLRTGDLGRLDARNRLFLLGRKKDVIVTGEGFNVHAADVEAALNGLPGVEDSVVLGVERNGHTEVHAVLVVRGASGSAPSVVAGASPASIISQANQTLLPHQRIASWSVWPDPDFPRTTLLKPRRAAIAERLRERAAPLVPPAAASLEDVLRIEDRQQRIAELARFIAHDPGDGGAAGKTSLVRDAGLSSLDAVELVALLERQSGRAMDRVPVDANMTVAELQNLVRDPASGTLTPLYVPDSPRWAEHPAIQALRRVVNPCVLRSMVRLRTRLTVAGLENLEGLEPPLIFAGAGHQHGFDALLIYSALPPRLRRRLGVVTSRWVFTYYLEPDAKVSFAQRFLVGLGFRLIVPFFFPNVLSSQFVRSRDGLIDACRIVDRGYSLIAFEGKGVGLVARQCGVPIVPVRLGTLPTTGFMPRLRRAAASLTFEPALRTDPTVPEAELTRALEALYDRTPRP